MRPSSVRTETGTKSLDTGMPKHSKEEAELERIAKNLLAMPHTDRDKVKFKTRKAKKTKRKPRLEKS
jgi:hypothetical protein